MHWRTLAKTYLFAVLLVLGVCAASVARCQSPTSLDDRYFGRKAHILDLLFRLDITPFFSKMTFRYGDSDSELVVLTYPPYPAHPGGQAEVVTYTIAGMDGNNLQQFISEMTAQSPNVTDQEIATRLKVDVKRSPINYKVLSRFLDDLKSIRMSPVLTSRVAIDEYSEYEFWYDTGQESVHYVITSPFGNDPQDKLGRWMIKFRDNLPNLLKAGSGPKR